MGKTAAKKVMDAHSGVDAELEDVLGTVTPFRPPSPIHRSSAEAGENAADDSWLRQPIRYTVFRNRYATRRSDLSPKKGTLVQVAERIERRVAPSKDRLPLLNFRRFGKKQKIHANGKVGSFRNDDNILFSWGLEGDYDGDLDGGHMAPEEAARLLSERGVLAIVTTTPSDDPDGVRRWRVWCGYSEERGIEDHRDLVGRLNGVLGAEAGGKGVLAYESFKPSQSYFYGSVEDKPVQVWMIDGTPIDFHSELDGCPLFPDSGDNRDRKQVASDKKPMGLRLDDIREMLNHIDPDCADEGQPMHAWVKVVSGVHHETEGSAEGMELVQDWSAKGSSYDADDWPGVWDRRSSGKNDATIKSVIRKAEEGAFVFKAMDADEFDPLPDEDESDVEEDAEADEDVPNILGDLLGDDVDEGAEKAPKEKIKFDHVGAVTAFVRRHKNLFRFDVDREKWFKFENHLWSQVSTKIVRKEMQNICAKMAENSKLSPSEVNKLRSSAFINGALDLCSSAPEFWVSAVAWDADPMLLATPGGVVDLKTGDLRPGHPEDYITQSTTVAPVPLDEFDAAEHCPRWMAGLKFWLDGEQDQVQMLKTFFGYSLTGSVKEEKVVLAHGLSGSGKSSIFGTAAHIFGTYGRTVDASMFTAYRNKEQTHKESIARLKGSRLIVASETGSGKSLDEAAFKKMSGGDRLTGNFMRENSIEFDPTFQCFIHSNHMLELDHNQDGVERRAVLLPLNKVVSSGDKDPSLKEVLLDVEAPGILSWMIQGCLDWQKNGIAIGKTSMRAHEEFFRNQDVFQDWLDERCIVGPGEEDTYQKIWDSWEDFCKNNNEYPGTRRTSFPALLKKRGFPPKWGAAGSRSRGYRGLRIRNFADEHFDGEDDGATDGIQDVL
ncbi:MAG: phage/plasmid primase, P4 family [Geminicoccaceae bacterium]